MKKEETFTTSKEAYDWCLEKGIVSQRVAEVLKVITDGGAMNQTMAHQAMIRTTGNMALEKYSISPRFAVLVRMGLIYVCRKGVCPVSGRTTAFYDATCSRPKCTEKEAINLADRRETLKALQVECRDLRDEVRKLRELLNMRSASFHEKEARIAKARPEIQQELFDVSP